MNWLELDEDPATLRAALALIDDCDDVPTAEECAASLVSQHTRAESGETTSETSSPSPSNEDEAAAHWGWSNGAARGVVNTSEESEEVQEENEEDEEAARRRIAASSNPRRQELLYLRQKASRLETQLKRLRKARMRLQGDVDPYSDRDTTIIKAKETVCSLWMNLAISQQRARQIAERENAQLRASLELQLKITRDFVRLLQKASTQEGAMVAQMTVPRIPIDMRQQVTEEELVQAVDALHAYTDAVFQTKRFRDGGEGVFYDAQVSSDGGTGAIIDLQTSYVFPFPAEDVIPVAWLFATIKTRLRDICNYTNNMAGFEDLRSLNFTAVLPSDKDEAIASQAWMGKQVLKKFSRGEDHADIVSIYHTEPVNASRDPSVAGLFSRESAWVRVIKSHTVSELASHPVTLYQCVRRVHIGRTTEGALNKRHIAALTQFMLHLIEEMIKWKVSGIENYLLLQQARRQAV
ncbi:hypothetical protein PINS_up012551 [Pythium insidiosum]|nr:hypothetical protein PINS_up012551 [Pythium insidiosum]